MGMSELNGIHVLCDIVFWSYCESVADDFYERRLCFRMDMARHAALGYAARERQWPRHVRINGGKWFHTIWSE